MFFWGFILGEETNSLSGDGQEVLVGQGSQRLVKQLLGDGLRKTSGVKISDIIPTVLL